MLGLYPSLSDHTYQVRLVYEGVQYINGVIRLFLSLRAIFLTKMHSDIEDYVIKCHQCEVNKAQQLKATCFVRPLDIPNIKNRGEMVCATE